MMSVPTAFDYLLCVPSLLQVGQRAVNKDVTGAGDEENKDGCAESWLDDAITSNLIQI